MAVSREWTRTLFETRRRCAREVRSLGGERGAAGQTWRRGRTRNLSDRGGTAEVTQDGKTVAELGPGEFFGEMGVLERAPRNATVVAKTPMTLLTLTSWDVKRLESKSPEAMEQLQQVIEQRRAAG